MPDEIKAQPRMFEEAKKFDWSAAAKGSAAAQYQIRIAEIRIEFPEYASSLAEDGKLKDDLQSFFEGLADQRFGAGHIAVDVQLRPGSLTVLIGLAVVGTVNFFKDYGEVHDGVVAFAKDIEFAAGKIKEIIRKRADRKHGPDVDDGF
jgi:hypothetical protein